MRNETQLMKSMGWPEIRPDIILMALIVLGVLEGAPLAILARPLPAPAMAGPLVMPAPLTIEAGPLGRLELGGVVSGIGMSQGNWAAGGDATHWDLSNGQVFIQKTSGWWQFYLQAGAYNLPALGTRFLSTGRTLSELYGPVPVAYLKLVPRKNLSILVGALPTMIGAEDTFTFENMNIERGLLWNQENAINRGVQVNDRFGHLSASFSWNDGFYSNRYSWLSGSLAYSFDSANTLSFDAGGNLGQTGFRNPATPVQNNGSIYNIIYTYQKGRWTIQPYLQYTDVPTDLNVSIAQGAATWGGAFLANYRFSRRVSLAGRWEYIASTGNVGGRAVNLLYGPGSRAWSVTVTPNFQEQDFFLRAEISFVDAAAYTPGDAFGIQGMNGSQLRGVVEAGLLF